MILEDINKLLQKGEGIRVEYKTAEKGIPGDLWETIVSFSNTDGGIIFLGVNDDGEIRGINPEFISKYQKEIVTNLKNDQNINPPLFLMPSEFKHPEGIIIYIQVPASSQVHDHAGKIYYREADADLDITKNQKQISSLYLRKQNIFTETLIYKHLTIDDLNDNLFDKARSIIRGYQPHHPWIMANNEQILHESSLYRNDYMTGEKGLTLAAALIFGKDTTIHNILPAYKVEAMVRRVNLDRYDDRITLRTNLIDTYLHLIDFVKKHLNEHFFTEDGQRKDLRELIFREIIGNLIVHREYTQVLSSNFIIYKDKIVVTNPNKALFHGPIDSNNFNPFPKNPNIRKFFTAFGWTDEIGSGIRNTNKYLSYYIPGAKPIFYEDDLFKTEIP
ncbi:MAG: putative DNA binding domain-containing protein, partial [Spirochaetales bacterium]|nr:putative DNA binding domain-containing protein [Spirochaetales bacterium]